MCPNQASPSRAGLRALLLTLSGSSSGRLIPPATPTAVVSGALGQPFPPPDGLFATHRRFEISVRRALGAPSGRLLRTVVGRAVAATAAGAVIGLVASVALGRIAQSLLFRISATDPATYLAACATLLAAALVAGVGPALRALRAAPAAALREEV